MVADWHHFEENQDLDPDQHYSEKRARIRINVMRIRNAAGSLPDLKHSSILFAPRK
jgi:hypothetical protein